MAGETPAPVGGTPTPPTTPTTPQPPPTPTPGETPAPLSWDGWLAQQPDDVKALLDEHVRGLKSSLQSERGTRGALEKQLRDLQAKAEKGSELEKQLGDINAQLAQENTRADFYEALGSAGATNLKRIYTLARADGLIDEKGRFKLDDMKSAYPEYFTPAKPVVPVGNAGSGTQQPAPALSGNAAVNNWIRSAAGLS